MSLSRFLSRIRLGELIDAPAEHGFDGGARHAVRGHADDARLGGLAGPLGFGAFFALGDSVHAGTLSARFAPRLSVDE
jgi:hypothetical protein